MKDWRILNLNTGTFYSMHFVTREEADAAISEGEVRGDLSVKRISLPEVLGALADTY